MASGSKLRGRSPYKSSITIVLHHKPPAPRRIHGNTLSPGTMLVGIKMKKNAVAVAATPQPTASTPIASCKMTAKSPNIIADAMPTARADIKAKMYLMMTAKFDLQDNDGDIRRDRLRHRPNHPNTTPVAR